MTRFLWYLKWFGIVSFPLTISSPTDGQITNTDCSLDTEDSRYVIKRCVPNQVVELVIVESSHLKDEGVWTCEFNGGRTTNELVVVPGKNKHYF